MGAFSHRTAAAALLKLPNAAGFPRGRASSSAVEGTLDQGQHGVFVSMDTSDPTRTVIASEVAAICGELDERTIADIVATGATPSEVLEAHTWLSSDDYLHRAVHRAPAGTVAEVCRILEDELRPPDDPTTADR